MQFGLKTPSSGYDLDACFVAMEIVPVAPLQRPDVALELFLAVHPDDHPGVLGTGVVPRRTYAATRKTYIGLREKRDAAVDRAMQLFDKGCSMERPTLRLLRIQFSHKGFAHYATKVRGPDEAFAPMFYKIIYPNDTSGKDYGAWAFHGDLPLQHSDEHGHVLITSEWTR